MTLAERANQINEELNEVVNLFIKANSGIDMFDDMSADDLLMMQKCMSLAQSTMTMMYEQARAIDEINRKLDRLLSK